MSRLPYDVSVVGDLKPIALSHRERIDLRNALGKSPSDSFIQAYAVALDSYIRYSDEAAVLGPKQVIDRLKAVLDNGDALLKAIDDLRGADRCYIGRFWTMTFLAGKDAASENQSLKSLCLYLNDVQSAWRELDKTQRKGRMPAYSAQALARTIADAIFLQTGRFPPLTRGGMYDKVLQCALNAGDKRIGRTEGIGRRDVMALMRIAKREFSEEEAKQFGEILRVLA